MKNSFMVFGHAHEYITLRSKDFAFSSAVEREVCHKCGKTRLEIELEARIAELNKQHCGDGAALYAEIEAELQRAAEKYEPEFADIMQALGVLYAEFCELRDEIIQHSPPERVREEAIQVAAMAQKLVRYLDGKAGGQS